MPKRLPIPITAATTASHYFKNSPSSFPCKGNQGGCQGIPFNLKEELNNRPQAANYLLGAIGTNAKLHSLVLNMLNYIPEDKHTQGLQAKQRQINTLQQQILLAKQQKAHLQQQHSQATEEENRLAAIVKSQEDTYM